MNNELNTTCCIAGGGPAGMMMGLLLARAGIQVIVLEKHGDFFRDFRGDTIHPSTFTIMNELGLLEEFLMIPHDEQTEVKGTFSGKQYCIANFARLPVVHKVIGFMPQWDFLDFLLKEAKKYSTFQLMLHAEAMGVIKNGNKVTGVRVNTPEGKLTINTRLLVAADGRGSVLTRSAGFTPIDTGAPMDVLWFRISRKEGDPEQTLLNLEQNSIFIAITRKEYYQSGFLIKKGDFDNIKKEGLAAFKERLRKVIPFAATRLEEIKDWNDIKLLSVSVSHLKRWYLEGFLCIGDAAHTMSPLGGVGINLALQDAVAAANILYKPLSNNRLNLADVKKVQDRRSLPSRLVQRMQITLQNMIISPVLLHPDKEVKAPLFIKILQYLPVLRTLLGRFIGIGIRPERVRTPVRTNAT